MSSSEIERIKILKTCFGHFKQERKELLFKCPFCFKDKMSINVKKNVYKCWVCSARGKIPFLLKKTGNSRYLGSFGEAIFSIDDFVAKHIEKKVIALPEDFQLLNKRFHPIAYDYIIKRGLTDQDIINYKLGFCQQGKFRNRIIVPSFDRNGQLNFFFGRTIDKENDMRYLTPFSSKDIVFNELLIDLDKDIVLTEGYFDSMLFPNSIPIFGTSLSSYRKITDFLIHGKKRVIIALDAGKKQHTLKICDTLSRYSIDAWYILLDSDGDFGDMRQKLGKKISPNKFNPVKYEKTYIQEWKFDDL